MCREGRAVRGVCAPAAAVPTTSDDPRPPTSCRYYADIRQTVPASDQEMNSLLAELSRVRPPALRLAKPRPPHPPPVLGSLYQSPGRSLGFSPVPQLLLKEPPPHVSSPRNVHPRFLNWSVAFAATGTEALA